MDKEIKALIDHYQFDTIPIEGTLYKSTYVSKLHYQSRPIGTAIIGMYCHSPKSISNFHRLTQDEVWHFYGGDPFVLHLLHPNGKAEKIIMGNDILHAQKVQFVVPANVWQAGELLPEGKYALYGCTLAPGFTGDCFEGGSISKLLQQYPKAAKVINRLGLNEQETKMPDGYKQ